MSTPAPSSSNTSYVSTDEPSVTAAELSRILMDDDFSDPIYRAFHPAPVLSMTLRHYLFISINIERIRRDLDRHRIELDTIFQLLLSNDQFQRNMNDIVLNYRDRLRSTRTFTPPPQTVEIHDERSNSSNNSSEEFHTPEAEEQGTRNNPIDVDFQPPSPHPTHLALIPHITSRRTRSTDTSTFCTTCARVGHTRDTCIWRGRIQCDYCREVGAHLRNNCPVLRRDIVNTHPRYQYCVVCNQVGHSVDRCWAVLHPTPQ